MAVNRFYSKKERTMESNLVPRHKQKIITEDTVAIRKMRELRKYSRAHAGVLLQLSAKQIEAIENGRVQLTPERIVQFRRAYSFSESEHKRILSGKASTLSDLETKQKPKIIEHKSLRRSYRRNITKEVKAIISLRKRKGLTQYEAGFRCGYPKCTFGHIENGRIELSTKRIMHILSCLDCTEKDFKKEILADQTRHEIEEKCLSIIRRIDDEKLRTVLPLLETMK